MNHQGAKDAKGKTMDNPLEQPAPDDPIERVHTIARDLAYGVTMGLWGPSINASGSASGEYWLKNDSERDEQGNDLFKRFLREKWNNDTPLSKLLLSFGYFTLLRDGSSGYDYLLTQKAFALLEQPITPPKIFVSYKHEQSSALALLVEARLRIADSTINVFMDKLLKGGEVWEQRLEDSVRESEYLIALLAPGTLESGTVQKEIRWALDSDSVIICILHGGLAIEDIDYPELTRNHVIVIDNESSKEYESAINDLLNALGYPTY